MKNSFFFACLFLCFSFIGQIPTQGLVGYWSFSGNAQDESGNGNNASLQDGATFSEDRHSNQNSSIHFSSFGSYLNFPSGSNTSINITGDYTISYWIKTMDNSGFIVSFGDTQFGTKGYASALNPGNIGNNIFAVSNLNNVSYWYAFPRFVSDNLWHHIVYTFEGTTLRLYCDNQLLNTFTNVNIPSSYGGSRFVGKPASSSVTLANKYTGYFDDFAIYNRALNTTEVDNLFSETSTSCILASYDFNGNANDISGNNLHGVVNGASLTNDRFGNLNSAYYFDGIDDYIEVLDNSQFNFENNKMSISYWLKLENLPNDPNNEKILLSKQSESGDLQNGFNISYSQNNTALKIKNGSGGTLGQAYTDYGSNLNQWNHYIFTWDGTIGKAYENGVLVNSYSTNNAIIGSINLPLLIGKPNWISPNAEHFNGFLDDLTIYSCALTQNDIDSIFSDCSHFFVSLTSEGSTTVCEGDSITLKVQNNQLYTYKWYKNDELISNNTSELIVHESGFFKVEVSNGECLLITNLVEIIVNPLATVSAGTYASVCLNSPNVDLIGFPTGGEFVGIGVSNNEFNPSYGSQNITYRYSDDNGCYSESQTNIIVNEIPNITLTGVPLNTTTCDNGYVLTTNPLGGVLSGNGIVNGVFYPNIHGLGNAVLSYEFVDQNECSNISFIYSSVNIGYSDTSTIIVQDTNFIFETYIDTILVYHTINDTIIINEIVYDTIIINETLIDTIFVNQIFYDTVTHTEYYYDTVQIIHTFFDTTLVTIIDTVYNYISVTDTLYINTILSVNSTEQHNLIKIFPNPANTHIYINTGNFNSLEGYKIRIDNSLAQIVFETNINQQEYYIDLNNWSGNGTYFLYLIDYQNTIIEVKKIVLQ
jgi:hypothetical protein